MRRFYYPLLFSIVVLLVWEFVFAGQVWPDYLLPKPSQIVLAMEEFGSELFRGSLSTLTNALVGLLWALVLGVALALVFSVFRWLSLALMPFTVFFQTVPVIAVAPLLVIWFGFGAPTVRASAFIVAFFPILANALSGLKSVHSDYLELAQIHQFSRASTVLRIQFPFAVASILVGLNISGGLAVVGAIVGEFIAGGGLGAMIDSARSQQRVDLVFAAIILSALLGLLVIALLGLLSSLLRKWRPFVGVQ